MNGKYQAVLLAIFVVGAIIAYFTAESPFSIVGGAKIHPMNCKCFTCKPNTPYKGNALELFRKKAEPAYQKSPSRYSSNQASSTNDNLYSNT